MSSSVIPGVRRALALLAAGTVVAGTASAAGAQAPPGGAVQPRPADDGAQLRAYLTALGNNPRSVDLLLGAGRAALRMGDADAALTFFGRADEASPRHPRVKAGMGSALVQLGQAQAALSLFAEALALGATEGEILGDRGLAYDMAGDPRRAQQDYVAALRRYEDPELRRRLALSLAISGHREGALRTIDAQLRRDDRAAWRAQAFILALTGDAAGAGRTAQAQMGMAGAQQMAPFFARLHSLSPAQKALAVHLGRFPTDGRAAVQTAPVDISPDPAALALAGVGAARPGAEGSNPGPASRRRTAMAEREPARPRRRARPDPSDPYGLRDGNPPASREAPPARAQPEPQLTDVAEVNTRWAGSPYQPPSGAGAVEAPVSSSGPPPGAARSPSDPVQPAVTPVQIPASSPAQTSPAEPAAVPSAEAQQPRSGAATAPAQAATVTESEAGAPSLEDIAALVNALPDEPRPQPTVAPPPATRRTEPVRVAEARTPARPSRPQAEAPAHPRRHWVQIAGGIDRDSLPREFARLRAKAPEQLGRRTAFTAAMRSTSRLLVGPFATASEAQEFVNQLARHDVAAFAWTSAAGQEIERLASR